MGLDQVFLATARSGDLKKLKDELLGDKVDLAATDEKGLTYLHHAVEMGDVQVAKMLIDAGADVNARITDGFTALNLAVVARNKDMVKLLIDEGADVNGKFVNEGTNLELCLFDNAQVDIGKLLIDAGADLNATDKLGLTALICAVVSGHEDFAKLLIDEGADVNFKSSDGATALMFAVKNELVNTVDLLIEAGAEVNDFVKLEGMQVTLTPLLLASRTGRTDIPQILLNAGADIDVTDDFGRTCLHFAMETGNIDLIKLLLSNGADPTRKTKKGGNQTCLDVKVKNTITPEEKDALVKLLEFCADTDISKLLRGIGLGKWTLKFYEHDSALKTMKDYEEYTDDELEKTIGIDDADARQKIYAKLQQAKQSLLKRISKRLSRTIIIK